MATQSAPLVSLQAPKDVSLGEIESELAQIWKMYSAANLDGSHSGATRAATFTLIVYESTVMGEAQNLLSILGFYRGPIDGIYGPQMEVAVKTAQKAYELTTNGKINSELLEKLRQAVAQKAATEGEVLPPNYAANNAGAIADAIASQNPCRIISLLPVPGEDEGVTAQVSAYCPIQKRGQSTLICCEYITLRGTEKALERVSSLVSSLLISELPKFLWWKANPDPATELFRKVGSMCNSVIVDSSGFQKPETELRQLIHLMEDGIQVADLNWSRLAAWQELAAEAFDPPERRADLKEVDQVTIDYEKGNATQALMYVGWLASRLNWKPVAYQFSGNEADYDLHHIEFMTNDNRTVKAELAGVPIADAGDVVGDLIGLRLGSTNPNANCNTILCSETTGCMRMEAGGAAQSSRIQQVTSLADQRAEVMLGQQVQRWGRDVLYEESMQLTAQILHLR